MRKTMLMFCATVTTFAAAATGEEMSEPEGRYFYMGFQDFAWDKTEEGAEATYDFLEDNADIVCLQFGDTCPWQEAYEDKPFPEELQDRMERRKEGVGPDKKIYLEITPLDEGRAGIGGDVSGAFEGKSFDDPMVKEAFVKYAKRMVDFYAPAYLCIGVEVNELAGHSPELWPAYVELHKHARRELKKAYPDLPVFASITLHTLLRHIKEGQDETVQRIKDFMPHNDVAGISFYTFLGDWRDPENPTKNFDWIGAWVGDMPMAITETAYPAEPIALSSGTYEADPQAQVDYLETVFKVAQRDQYLFVINFCYRDYDIWWEKTKDVWPEWVKSWKDTGVVDGDGAPRPALDLWRGYLAKPKAANPMDTRARLPVERPFLMGFQDVSWDDTEESVQDTYAFLEDNADIVCLQTNGGIPWEAAYKDEYPERIQERWARRKAGVGDNAVYLEIGPLNTGRTGIGGHAGDFGDKPFDDPMVKEAYLNFARREIEAYHPKYLGVGIEVNELYDNTPALWDGYVNLHKYVYAELKKDYPELPIAATMTLHRLLSAKQGGDQDQLDVMKSFLEYSDFAGISYYPFIGNFHDFDNPTEQFDWVKDFVGGKPIAITEIAYPGEPIAWGGEVRYPANPEDQKRFVETLLEAANRDDYLFVIYWAHRDWDARWERVKDQLDEMWTAWRDIGLLDGEGNARPACEIWKQWLLVPYTRGG